MDRPFARRVLPEFTERAPDGSRRTVDPYSKLLAERIVMLGTPLDEAAAGDVVAQLLHLESAAPDRPISLHLNSPGGSFTAMTAVLDALGFVGCEVETVCLGQASSVAVLLLAAGTPGRRLALPHARVVIGQPTTAEPYQGQPSDIERHAAELLRQRETLIRLLARHTGQSERTIGRDIERETVFDAERARAYGLVDHLTRARGARGSARIGG